MVLTGAKPNLTLMNDEGVLRGGELIFGDRKGGHQERYGS